MKDLIATVQLALTGLGGFLGWFFGGIDGFMYALVIFVAIDYITGVMVAILEKKISSEIGFRGIFKKVVIFCLVGIGQVLDTQIIKSGSALRTAIIFFYLSNEGISILENVSNIGLPVPDKLINVLGNLHRKYHNDGEEEKEENRNQVDVSDSDEQMENSVEDKNIKLDLIGEGIDKDTKADKDSKVGQENKADQDNKENPDCKANQENKVNQYIKEDRSQVEDVEKKEKKDVVEHRNETMNWIDVEERLENQVRGDINYDDQYGNNDK